MRRISLLAAAVCVLGFTTPVSAQGQTCLTTLFATNNGGSVGGAVYFDIKVTNAVRIVRFETNYDVLNNAPVGLKVYITPTTSVGKETNKAAWKLVAQDNGTAKSAGRNNRTQIILASPFVLTPGSFGMALVSVGDGHRYTNGTGSNQSFSDANIALALGKASNVPFTGGLFSPRVWNGSICYTPAKGLFTDFTATPRVGKSPLKVQFTDQTFTSNPPVKTWAWDLNGDNRIDSTLQNPTFIYPPSGFGAKFDVTLTTTDGVNPPSKVTKKGFISVDPVKATAVNYGAATTSKPVGAKPYMPIPAYSRTFNDTRGFPRGFYFQTPITFVVLGFQVPNESNHTLQTVAFYLLSAKPPEFAMEVIPKASELKFFAKDQKANTLLKPATPIVVPKGSWVAVLGGNHEVALTMSSSYSVTGIASTKTTVLGQPVSIGRLISQHVIRANNGLGGIAGNGTTGNKGRVQIHIAGQSGFGTIFPSQTTIGVPGLGQTPQLDIMAKIPSATAGLLLVSSQRANLKTPFGTLLVASPFGLTLPVPGGTGKVPVAIPVNRSLLNALVDFQTFVVAPSTSTFGATNGTEWRIGQ